MNPRFAVACTDALLEQARGLAGDDRPIQTHLSESVHEVRAVAELFPDDPHYAGVYDRHGLLTPRTLLAHCLHLTPAEWDLLAERDAVVVHCPTANTFLRAGLFPLSAARARSVRVALGSDIAAGPDAAMPRVARAMIEIAKLRALTIEPDAPIPTPADAWTTITRDNADAVGFSGGGRLEIGAPADLLVLEPPFEPDDHFIGRLIYTWDDNWITARILNGALT